MLTKSTQSILGNPHYNFCNSTPCHISPIFVSRPALLALASGTIYKGTGFGASGKQLGEVVFNTGMTGYQEILTDPSYLGQIVVLTSSHIGNTGTNSHDDESNAIHASGLVVRELSRVTSNWRCKNNLDTLMQERQRPGISGIDVRQLVRSLRDGGAQNGCLMVLNEGETITDAIRQTAIDSAKAMPPMTGQALAKIASCSSQHCWDQPLWQLPGSPPQVAAGETAANRRVAVLDFGVKFNILRSLRSRGLEVEVFPADTSPAELLATQPDGILLSNGPGDPEPCLDLIDNVKALLAHCQEHALPLMAICLGMQIMALALNGRTRKMLFGHHGINHPVRNSNGSVAISSQNHGFCVDVDSLPAEYIASHTSLFDHTLQGIRHRSAPIFAVQGHPEASPGPTEMSYVFDAFAQAIQARPSNT